MRNSFHLMTFVAAATVCITTTFATASDFIQTAGPEGGRIDSLAMHGNTAWAATQGGFYRSDNAGATWSFVGASPISTIWRELHVTNQGMVAIGWTYQAYRSGDGGANWSAVDFGTGTYSTAKVSRRGETLYALLDQTPDTFHSSADGGTTWTQLTLPADTVTDFLANDNAILVAADFNSIFRSLDFGQNWTPINTGFPNDIMARHSVGLNSMLMQASFSGQIFRSDDDGVNWKQIDPPFAGGFFISPLSVVDGAAVMYAAYVENNFLALYQSADDGATWGPISTAGLPSFFVNSSSPQPLAANGQNLLVAFSFSSGGIFRSIDAGANWNSSSEGVIATNIFTLGVAGQTLFASGPSVEANYFSSDEGETWTHALGLPELISYIGIDNDSIIAGSRSTGVFRTDNGGSSWSPINTGMPHYGSMTGDAIQPINDLIAHNNFTFAATGGGSQFIGGDDHCGCTGTTSGDGVYRSSNGGASWQRVSNGLPINMFHFGQPILRPITALQSVNGALLAATPSHGVFRSTNDGSSWSPTTGVTGGVDFALFNGHVYLAVGDGAIYRSTNGGQNWSLLSHDLPSGTFGELYVFDGAIYAASGNNWSGANGVYRSTNGTNWTPVTTTLADKKIMSITSVGDELYVGVENRGVWKLPNPIASDLNNDGVVNVSDLFMLLAAWGNCAQPCPPSCPGDLNQDCNINVTDLFQLLADWTG